MLPLSSKHSCCGLILVIATLSASAAPAKPVIPCAEIASLALKDLKFGKPIENLEATQIAAQADAPEHCHVEGRIWPETKFVLKLPIAGWNNRFVMTGNGGPAGVVRLPALMPFLSQGYAVAGDSGGHLGDRPLFSFAYNPPDNSNPHAAQKLEDLAYRSIHESTHLSRAIIKAFYGEAASHSYYVGASQGGRQGMKIAQVHPEDFDGWVIGYPVLDMTGVTMQGVWNAQALRGPGAISTAQLPALSDAIHAKCDPADGLRDGLISDPAHCSFDPRVDLPKCKDSEPAGLCFTGEQIEALLKIQTGPQTSRGERLFLGTPLASAVSAPVPGDTVRSLWIGPILPMNPSDPSSSLGFAYGESYVKSVLMKSPTWDWTSWTFDDYVAKARELHETIDAIDPDLQRVRSAGKKILQYHGWADALVTPYVSIDYYEKVRKTLGADETESFYKLYMIPGMGHGPSMGPSNVGDWLSILRGWVEEGEEPQALIASRPENAQAGLSAMTRPLCPYPKVARYRGSGDTNDAASFACVTAR